MSSLIETTVGEVLAACERTHAHWSKEYDKASVEFDKKVTDYEALPWWKKFGQLHPNDWRSCDDVRMLVCMDRKADVHVIQESVKNVSPDTAMWLSLDDALCISLGK